MAGLSDYRPQYFPQDTRTRALSYSLALQRAQLAAMGGKVPKDHPSILNRVLDLVSRPNYAVANTYNTVVNRIKENQKAGKGGNIAELPGLVGRGFLGGLEGKNKTRFSDVYGNLGVKNNLLRAGLGLGTDIATDPLNFVGPGIEKAVSPLAESATTGSAIAGAAGKGVKVDDLLAAGQQASNAARAAQPGRITLEVLGRPVAGSEALYKGLAAVGRPLAQSAAGQTLSEAFRTAHNLPGILKDYYRVNKISGAAAYNDVEGEIISRIGSLSRDEASRVSHAIDAGVDLTGQASKSGLDLGEVQKYARDTFHDWSHHEQQLGIFRPGQGIDNFVPHKFASKAEYELYKSEGFSSKAWRATQDAIDPSVKKATSMPTLMDLKTAGLHPHENIVDLMRLRAADHFRDISKAAFHKNALETFGEDVAGKGAKATEEALKKSGWKRVTKDVSPFVGQPNIMAGAQNVWVPEQVHNALSSLNKFYASDEATTKLMQTFDNIQRLWKTGVTTVNPSHHIRNMIGDAFLNFEAGVNSPADYERAMKVLLGKGQVKVGNMLVDTTDLNNLYHIHGGSAGFFNTDLVGGGHFVGSALENPASKLNRGMEVLRDVTAKREDFMRLANFTHGMREYGSGANTWADLQEAAAKATSRVRKFNFDYGDLTPFESKLRRAVPFYTFMRKNIPLQLEMLALHPNKISRVPQGFAAIQNLLGVDAAHLPIQEVVPQYIKDLSGVRLRGEGQGKDALYSVLNTPLTDVSQLLSGSTSDVLRKVVGQTSPFIRMPIELGTKKSLLTGAPIYQGPGGYALDQFGISRNLRQSFSHPQPHSVIFPGDKQAGSGMQWLDWLSGLGLKKITPAVERSELKRQQAPVSARLKQLQIQRKNRALGHR